MLCELRPEARRKILAFMFYRPPNSNLDHLKELKKSLRNASQFNFDQIIICGDFNLPDIDWSTGIASTSESLHNYFTKFVKENYLWQLVNFPTRNKNILDLSPVYTTSVLSTALLNLGTRTIAYKTARLVYTTNFKRTCFSNRHP